MTSISFDEIYSRFYTKVEAYDLLDIESSDFVAEFMCNWLRATLFYPHVRKVFSEVNIDEEEEVVSYEMRYSIDEVSDKEFVIDLLAWGIVYNWTEPKINSITNIVNHFGETDTKWYSQAAHLAQLRGLRDDSEKKMRSLPSDRGYLNNIYLDGMAASAKILGRT